MIGRSTCRPFGTLMIAATKSALLRGASGMLVKHCEPNGMLQRELICQQIHDYLIMPPTIYQDLPTKPTDVLESEALVYPDCPSIVAIHLSLDAVEIAKDEAIFANETRCLRAEAFAPLVPLADPDEHGGRRGARDIKQTADSYQSEVREHNYRELDAVGFHPRVLVKTLLPHLERVRFAGDSYESCEFEVLVPLGDRRYILLAHERQSNVEPVDENRTSLLVSIAVRRHRRDLSTGLTRA
jgi:hypothetical protein